MYGFRLTRRSHRFGVPVFGVIMPRFWIAGGVVASLIAPVPLLAQSQTPPPPPALAPVEVTTPPFDSAYYAWQAGNYPEALQRFERLLNGPQGSALLDRIALVTGELYQTTELNVDGAQPRWSRDSRALAFTSVTGPARVIHFFSLAGSTPRETGTATGFGVVFSPTRDEAAYLAVNETAELAAARAAMEGAQDFQTFNRARGDVIRLEAANSHVRARD